MLAVYDAGMSRSGHTATAQHGTLHRARISDSCKQEVNLVDTLWLGYASLNNDVTDGHSHDTG